MRCSGVVSIMATTAAKICEILLLADIPGMSTTTTTTTMRQSFRTTTVSLLVNQCDEANVCKKKQPLGSKSWLDLLTTNLYCPFFATSIRVQHSGKRIALRT